MKPTRLDRATLESALFPETPPRILVLGDLMLDRYVRGEVGRISPEAPIPVFEVRGEPEDRAGGSANVGTNLVALGATPLPVGILGKDADGRRVRAFLRRHGIPTEGIVEDSGRPTTIKTRYLAHDQQVLRVDREDRRTPEPAVLRKVNRTVARLIPKIDAVLVSDYGKGIVCREVLRETLRAARRRKIPVLVDPKGTDYTRYRGATLVTPNRSEAAAATGIDPTDRRSIRRAAERLKRDLRLTACAITLGSEGIAILADGRFEILPARARGVYDVTGAGDTVLAVMGLALAGGLDPFRAAAIGNLAAGIVVGRLGAATASPEEILDAHEAETHPADKRIALPELVERLAAERRKGKRIVFTNGCFDLIHPGHVRILREAKRHGDVLVVGLNADRSVRILKGSGRPILKERERAAILSSLAAVDHVVLFGEKTPLALIRKLKPDVLVKGADYTEREVVGRDVVERNGGKVILVPLVKGQSTTGILQRLGREAAS